MPLKYDYTHNGNACVYYTAKNKNFQKIRYCAQENGWMDFTFYRCSMDGEPSHECIPKGPPELSPGFTSTDIAVNDFIKRKWNV